MDRMMSQMSKVSLKGTEEEETAPLLDRSCGGFQYEGGSRLVEHEHMQLQFEFAVQENVFELHYLNHQGVEHYAGKSAATDGSFVMSYIGDDSGSVEGDRNRAPHARLLVRTKLGTSEYTLAHWVEASTTPKLRPMGSHSEMFASPPSMRRLQSGSELTRSSSEKEKGVKRKNQKHSLKHMLSTFLPKLSSKHCVAVPPADIAKLSRTLARFHQSQLITCYKFGIMLALQGQVDEDEIMRNRHPTPAFSRFLSLLGDKVKLSGFSGFRGGLDNRGDDTTGEYSIHTIYEECEIMFHVATMLPYTEDDPQQIAKKRHIGNDIVVLIYKEGDTPFPASIITSNFNHIFIVVSEDPDTPDHYRIAVAKKDGVGRFGPSLPYPPLFHRDHIRSILLTKMINAEWAAYRSPEFDHKNRRTRQMLIDDMCSDYLS
eukprot:TRINITY_DN3640_c0_g1_i1.p1 TRINITY_DN3640_c0_g1~~TRINITY_DN3640_c0_g1_i1.p1  ORF type:complete len:464 (-),score=81.91 TRINITY_DN3640_c0_g1_i1:254-1540(-)